MLFAARISDIHLPDDHDRLLARRPHRRYLRLCGIA